MCGKRMAPVVRRLTSAPAFASGCAHVAATALLWVMSTAATAFPQTGQPPSAQDEAMSLLRGLSRVALKMSDLSMVRAPQPTEPDADHRERPDSRARRWGGDRDSRRNADTRSGWKDRAAWLRDAPRAHVQRTL